MSGGRRLRMNGQREAGPPSLNWTEALKSPLPTLLLELWVIVHGLEALPAPLDLRLQGL